MASEGSGRAAESVVRQESHVRGARPLRAFRQKPAAAAFEAALDAMTTTIRKLRDRDAASDRLRSAEERFRTLVEQLPLAVYVDAIDAGSSNIYSSPQIEPMLGYTTEEWRDQPDLFVRLLHPDDRERVLEAHARAHIEGTLSLEYRLIARDGRTVWVQDEARTIVGANGAEALQGYLLDVTERRAAEELLRHRAHHDQLTGLPTRRLFGERVDAAIAASGRQVAVLIVDLDDFKAVNDRLGHLDGDAVLVEAASRLRTAVPDTLTLARLGGDEFAVLVDTATPEPDSIAIAEAVIEALREPAAMDDLAVSVTASVGIATGDDPDRLFRHADLALYRAKGSGKAQFVLYDASMGRALSGRLALVGELRRARIERDFILHYQPVVGLDTGRISGAEALVRWANPDRGVVSPGEFVPIAEESGVIVPLGRWVLREACAQLSQWRESVEGGVGLTVSVNVSARQLQSGRFVEDVVEALEAAKLEPGGLILEITEATVVHDPQVAADLLRTLRAMGVGLMLDDFGTGHSSLSVLDSLPFDGLKLDRSSVTRLDPSGGGIRLVRAIVDLGRALGLSLVAEGIEGEHQRSELERLGVRHGQGFLFAQPLVPAELAEMLCDRASSRRSVAA